MTLRVLSVACFLFLLQLAVVDAEDKLILAQAVFRHGARAPVTLFTTEESKNYFWRGLGQLTDEGVRQAYDLGKALRFRLVDTGFLDKRNNPNEVAFFSSPRTRCIITASTVGAALFDPIHNNVINTVAIQTEPFDKSYLTYPHTSPSLLEEIRTTIGVPKNKTEIPEDVMGWVIDENARNSTYFREEGRTDEIEALVIEKPLGLAVASWFDENAEKEANALMFKAMEAFTGTGKFFHEKWIKCRSGFLLHTLMKDIKERAACRSNCSSVKFNAFSTHDLMLKPLLQSLGVMEPTLHGDIPPFTATILIELWQSSVKGREPYVKLLWKSPEASFIPVTSFVPGCSDDNCPVTNFTRCCSNFETGSPQTECSSNTAKLLFTFLLIGIISIFRWEL